MELVGWVAVGVFAMTVNGAPQINVEATDNLFESELLCKAQVALVQERLDTKPVPAGVVLLASGMRCVEVKIKSIALKPNL